MAFMRAAQAERIPGMPVPKNQQGNERGIHGCIEPWCPDSEWCDMLHESAVRGRATAVLSCLTKVTTNTSVWTESLHSMSSSTSKVGNTVPVLYLYICSYCNIKDQTTYTAATRPQTQPQQAKLQSNQPKHQPQGPQMSMP